MLFPFFMAMNQEQLKSEIRQELSNLCQGMMNRGLITGYNIISSQEHGDISINIRPNSNPNQLALNLDTTTT